jgi:hypothetical protein
MRGSRRKGSRLCAGFLGEWNASTWDKLSWQLSILPTRLTLYDRL